MNSWWSARRASVASIITCMRGALKQKGIRLTVVRNALAKRAFVSSRWRRRPILIDGPCAMVYGGDSIVDVAKETTEWNKKIPRL